VLKVCKVHGEPNGDPVGVVLRPACASGEMNGDPTDLAACRRKALERCTAQSLWVFPFQCMQAHAELNGDPSGVALRPTCASGEPNGDPTDLAVCRRQSPRGYSLLSGCSTVSRMVIRMEWL
jgi:hypothetical protein